MRRHNYYSMRSTIKLYCRIINSTDKSISILDIYFLEKISYLSKLEIFHRSILSVKLIFGFLSFISFYPINDYDDGDTFELIRADLT